MIVLFIRAANKNRPLQALNRALICVTHVTLGVGAGAAELTGRGAASLLTGQRRTVKDVATHAPTRPFGMRLVCRGYRD